MFITWISLVILSIRFFQSKHFDLAPDIGFQPPRALKIKQSIQSCTKWISRCCIRIISWAKSQGDWLCRTNINVRIHW